MLNIQGYRIYLFFKITTTPGWICLLNQLENSFVQLCHLVRCNIKEYYTIIHVHQYDTNNQTLVDQIISI